MDSKSNFIGWLLYETESQSNELISKINECKGWPTVNTKTWSIPICKQYGYSPTATTENWCVIIKNEIINCLNQEEKDNIINVLPNDWYDCGTPITGDTINKI